MPRPTNPKPERGTAVIGKSRRMSPFASEGEVALRLMRDEDCGRMATWLSDPRVLEFYDGRDRPSSLEQVKQTYAPAVLAAEGVQGCMILLAGEPIGYAQYYRVSDEIKTEYGLDSSEDVHDVVAIDQFIGEPALWNRGIGTRAVSLLVRFLFEEHGARRILLDPHADNPRAVRCYEKCGFRKVKLLPENEWHEGAYRDCWLMEIRRGT